MTDTSTSMKTGMEGSGISARHIVAIVISALIFGAVIYMSRLLPIKLGTVQLLYPAAIVAPLFGIWFGIWGATGLIVGNMLSMLVVGMNPALFPLALLGQFAMGFVPGVGYRKPRFDSAGDIVKFILLVVLGQLFCTALVALNLVFVQKVPVPAAWGIWLWMQLSNTLMAAIFSPLLFRAFSDYMKKSGLFFRRFLG